MSKRGKIRAAVLTGGFLILCAGVAGKVVKSVTVTTKTATLATCNADLDAKIAAVQCPAGTKKVIKAMIACKAAGGKFQATAAVQCETSSLSPSQP